MTKLHMLAPAAALAAGLVLALPAAAQPRDGAGPFARLDADGDGVVTREEMRAERAKQFDFIDTNRDGFISPAELAVAGPMAGPRPPREPRGAGRDGEITRDAFIARGMSGFERQDPDKDGRITREEATRRRAAAFDAMDANKDGRLTRQEMRAAHETRQAERRRRAFDGLDANKDGRIAREEFAAPALAHFDRADADRDGRVTRVELAAGGRMGGDRRPPPRP